MSPGALRRAILLLGPTGAGKSEVAMRLAEEFPLEIVSVDSALVYRGMDIGTAKPTSDMRRAVPHHLIDIRDPSLTYSAGDFVQEASSVMEQIWRRGRQPLLVGGTMLYFHALCDGLAALPERDLGVRARIDARAATTGWASLHAELERVDPQAAAHIHVNDPQRIQRALEVYELTGEPISRLQKRRVSALEGVQVLECALVPADRRELHARLAARFDAMLAAGFVDEVRTLRARGDLTAEHPSMRAVGYRQLWRHLSGECTLEAACERSLVATRQLAKRQLTWLRSRTKAVWFDAAHPDVAALISSALSESGVSS